MADESMCSAWLKDFFQIALGWSLGLATLSISRDEVAKKECLYQLNELKRLTEKLSQEMRIRSSEQKYHECILEAKTLLENLDVMSAGLAIPSYSLNQLISEALLICNNFNLGYANSDLPITSVAVRLMISCVKDSLSPDFESIKKIQKELKQSLRKRFFNWCCSYTNFCWIQFKRGLCRS